MEDYANATRVEYEEHDPVRGRAIIQQHDRRYLIVNPPAMPLSTKELDRVAELPYTRQYHPMYEALAGVPAIEEVKFSVIHNRWLLWRAATSAPWPSTGPAWSPPAVTRASSGR